MFRPARNTRSLYDWLTPLDGCPHCGYAYEREQGYFLLATWGSQYFVIAGFGLALGFTLESLGYSLTFVLWLTCISQFVLGFLFARHAKAFYLAIDHFIDPHVKHRSHERNP
ncbi:MAG TPA: hypothetical protein VHS31_20310 [Tepidisphaeraceae bacterium]|jgi:hypothetical protein|nr:hypothetical protein [Tepidisphaeraceae bacterium]